MKDEIFIQEVEHVAVEPVRIEREHNDVIVIEGVRYGGDFFRTVKSWLTATPLSASTLTSPQMLAHLGGDIRKEIDNAI
jgi:hypothetical protein